MFSLVLSLPNAHNKIYIGFMCMGFLSTCMPVHNLNAVPSEARRRHLVPWD